jgi:hypothetical protein
MIGPASRFARVARRFRIRVRLASISAMSVGSGAHSELVSPIGSTEGIGVGTAELLEFLDTSVLPIVDGGNAHAECDCCLLVTQSSTHDQTNRGLFIVRQVSQGCCKRPGVDSGNLRAPDTPIHTSIGSDLEPTFFIGGQPTPALAAHRLQHPSRTPFLVIPLANEVFTHTEEVTHGDLARFKIFETKEPKKDLLNHVLGTLRPDQTSNEGPERSVMLLVERTHHGPPGLRNRCRTDAGGGGVSRPRASLHRLRGCFTIQDKWFGVHVKRGPSRIIDADLSRLAGHSNEKARPTPDPWRRLYACIREVLVDPALFRVNRWPASAV